ncbi:MAG TPA: response regulator [Anaerolineales bacterium]|nr:response regulator [Anaerolineales bacterium]
MAPHRILIVEDQREVSRLLHSALDTLEYKLDIVEMPSGEEAILDSSRNPLDLLVSDYRLPGITGVELMRKVRKYRPNVKVILITGQTDPRIRREVSDAGADAFFIKPVPIADFLDSVERQLGLVGTILPPEPIAAKEEVEETPSLPDLMVNLRQELEAIAVLLLNDSGRILARAGDLPDSNEEISLLSSLLSIYSAGQKVARLIGQKIASNWYVFNGAEYDLVFAPVGSVHAMLVIGKDLADEEHVLKTVDIFSEARRNIELALGEIPPGIPATRETPTTPLETVEPSTHEMEPLFKEGRKKLKSDEVNDFWDKAADAHKAPTKPDMLSYEQAKQLGLAPEDEP